MLYERKYTQKDAVQYEKLLFKKSCKVDSFIKHWWLGLTVQVFRKVLETYIFMNRLKYHYYTSTKPIIMFAMVFIGDEYVSINPTLWRIIGKVNLLEK